MSYIGDMSNTITFEELAADTRPADIGTICRQIGGGNIAAISGRRVDPFLNADNEPIGVWMPAGKGYHVMVTLAGNDTYTVRRLFIRSGKFHCKGVEQGVYAENVGDAAYRASCYVNVEFGTD